MLLTYEQPYCDANKRGFPLDIAYIRYRPEVSFTPHSLLGLFDRLYGTEGAYRILLLRPFGEADLTLPRDAFSDAWQQRVAEGYACVGEEDYTPVCTAITEEWPEGSEDEEAVIVRSSLDMAVAFYHDGHEDIEILAHPSKGWACFSAIVSQVSL